VSKRHGTSILSKYGEFGRRIAFMEATMIVPKCDEDIPRILTTLALNKNT